MDIVCRCAQCSTQFKVDAKYSGRRLKCPRCDVPLVVPTDRSTPETLLDKGGDRLRARTGPNRPRFLDGDVASEGVTVPDIADADAIVSAPESPTNSDGKEPLSPPTSTSIPEIQLTSPPKSKPTKSRKLSRRSPSKLPWIIAGALAAVLLVVVGVIAFAMSWSGATPGRSVTPAIVIDWPENERLSGGIIYLNGEKVSLPKSGEIRLPLSAGKHRLELQRRGFQQVEWSFQAQRGQTLNFRPKWEALSFHVPSSPGGSTLGPSRSTDEATATPLGFPGWLQLFDVAKRNAAEKKLDILIVFCGSDWHAQSIKMANEIFSNERFLTYARQRFALLVIDSPRTSAGYNLLADSGQNRFLFRQFDVLRSDRLPHIVLTDANGIPYARDGYFDQGIDNYIKRINSLQSTRAERDRLLIAAKTATDPTARLTASRQVLEWLRERDLTRFYSNEIKEWLRNARRIDPENELGALEIFFGEDWILRVSSAVQDASALKPIMEELTEWGQEHRFKDADRAVRLHLLAAVLSVEVLQNSEAALAQVAFAKSYEPTDPRLRERTQQLARRLGNLDQLASGTGFVVSSDGLILTNHHVVAGPGNVIVRLASSDERIPATVEAYDEASDIALLRVAPSALASIQPLKISDAKVGRGTNVAAFGFPLGDVIGSGLKLTAGLVTGFDEANRLILDARVNPGNSGGPLCNQQGHVIGMVTAKSQVGEGIDSYGVAIPAKSLIEFAQKHGTDLPLTVASDLESPPLDWPQVDELVQHAVVMVQKVRD